MIANSTWEYLGDCILCECEQNQRCPLVKLILIKNIKLILNLFTLDWGSKEYIKQGSVGWLWFTKVSFNINNNSNNDSNILGLPGKDVHVLLFKVFIKQ